MAVLTLAVFGQAQNTGPESAIRQYHQALVASPGGNDRGPVMLQQREDVTQPFNQLIEQLLRAGAQVRFGRITKQLPDATVEVAYLRPNGETWAFLYVLRREQGVWRVDVEQTARGSLNRT
ncbi:MAG TPA: hypothetical protein PLB31_04020 [Fimbriimonadaceae bacterium]|nr:hypothetical protein [Armatimonadota bacterium]HCM73877.1 hypothetical protein [Armatimonadota bacterium]HRD31964.1 hypothetical protein [Fimbriimonadaceae bacterium]HRE92638.1 hypothetical protein [Fimbriimonadaceae bacterium]HRI73619.1 hypothetical protein [Fimbriimonadaceae bacterium]